MTDSIGGALEQEGANTAYNWSRVDEALASAAVSSNEDLKKKYVFPGAVLLVARGGEILYHRAFGSRSIKPDVTPLKRDMVFDIASLTKALVTTTIIMKLVDSGLLTLDRRLSRIFQTFGTHGKERMTVEHLLRHCSGYPAHMPFYRMVASKSAAERAGMMTSRGAVEFVYNEIFRAKLENLPGKSAKYSDVGFILLGNVIEVVSAGHHLDKVAAKLLFKPLNLRETAFIDLSKIRRRGMEAVQEVIVPTAACPWRHKILCGEVHDDNAWAMGGIAGHAGIFSTATDLHTIAWELIQCYHGRGTLLSQDVVRKFWTVDPTIPLASGGPSTWALGWDTPSKENSSAGKLFSSKAVGHLGFTGCSIWIDPDRELEVILLSNRVHPSPDNNLIREFRPILHDLVMETLGYN